MYKRLLVIDFGHLSRGGQVLFRAPGGSIRDISSSTTAALENKEGHTAVRLTRIYDVAEASPLPQQVSFDLVLTNVGTEQAAFTGGLTQNGEDPASVYQCRGFFLNYRDTPLDVIQEGQKPLDQDVSDFLNVSPLSETGYNTAQTWADSLFEDVCAPTNLSVYRSFAT